MKRKDTRKRTGDRHKPGYMAEFMRKYRAKKASAALQAPTKSANNKDTQ